MTDNLVIVALPPEGDKINEVSIEKAAHVTLLSLGDNADISEDVVEYVKHAVETSFKPVYLEVRDRGPLGPDSADVLFFAGRGARQLEEFRSLLLKDPNIRRLYDAQDQYPTFTPHLTLGYPEAPAKEPEHQWTLESVYVDRIAVWTEDSAGVEFKPPFEDHESLMDSVGWAETVTRGEAVLEHYGVKGMKWGQRKAGSAGRGSSRFGGGKTGTAGRGSSRFGGGKTGTAGRGSSRFGGGRTRGAAPVQIKTDGQNNKVIAIGKDRTAEKSKATVVKVGPKSTVVTSKGGHNQVHPDAVKAKKANQKRKRSGMDTLSNKELKDLAERMNLEQRIKDLDGRKYDGIKKKGRRFINAADPKDLDSPYAEKLINFGKKVVNQ